MYTTQIYLNWLKLKIWLYLIPQYSRVGIKLVTTTFFFTKKKKQLFFFHLSIASMVREKMTDHIYEIF